MKRFLLTCCLLATAGSAFAQAPAATSKKENQPAKPLLAVVTTSRPDAEAAARANRLTDKMARQLQLNHYQTARLRALNRDKVRRMMEFENRPNADPREVDASCQGVCREQERELRGLLSTAQYADYYEARNDFYLYDKQFLTQARDNTRRPGDNIALPGATAAPELKDVPAQPVLRQGQ